MNCNYLYSSITLLVYFVIFIRTIALKTQAFCLDSVLGLFFPYPSPRRCDCPCSGNLVTSSLMDKAEGETCTNNLKDTTSLKGLQRSTTHGETVGFLSTQNELSRSRLLLSPTFMSIKSSNKANSNASVSRWRQTSVDFRQTFSYRHCSLLLRACDNGKRSGEHFILVLYLQ